MTVAPFLIRVEKGEPDEAELGALAAVLIGRASAPPPVHPPTEPAGWRRPERSPGFTGPRTWRDDPR